MPSNNIVQLCLNKGQSFISLLPPSLQRHLLRPILRKTLTSLAAIQFLRIVNRHLSQRASNNGVSIRPWNPSWEVAVVTGGSSGIGKQIMEDLSKLGVRVVILDIQEPKFALPSNVFFYNVDLTSYAAVKDAATQVRKNHGNPTILINNAGVAFMKTILDQPESEIRLTFEVNTLSHYWTVKEFLPDMVENDHGHIVTIASTASFVGTGAMADYCGSKAAVLAFHESLTQEIKHWYGSKRVRTSIIHPNFAQTPMTSLLHQHRALFGVPFLTTEEVSQAVVKQLVSGNGGQIIVPSFRGIATMVRGLPSWMQGSVRDFASGPFLRVRYLPQK
ncbi:hypothetical protein BJX63DRAFT_421607 [Aspergillus granulosus]|uniref:Uncharacterized protein n=1 Tax=Aspergillus granulosus TaxID=176169 RepID=A0ABR4HD69_9EURO